MGPATDGPGSSVPAEKKVLPPAGNCDPVGDAAQLVQESRTPPWIGSTAGYAFPSICGYGMPWWQPVKYGGARNTAADGFPIVIRHA